MANAYYAAGDQRSAKVHELFARIAPRYDLINDVQSFGLHRWWKRRLLTLSGARPGTRALDLCCGTGDVTFALARAGAQATGLDFNAPMLAVAHRRRAQEAASGDAENPVFLQGDALQLPFPDDQFDAVTISYGLRNLPNFERGLREMWRVAKPGGRLLVLDFGKPDNALWRALYFAYLRLCVPVFGWLFAGDSRAYAYILESLKHYPAQRGVAQIMERLGCRDVRIISFLGGMMSINYAEKPVPNSAASK